MGGNSEPSAASGIMDYLEDALKFYRIELVQAETSENWRCVLRKDKMQVYLRIWGSYSTSCPRKAQARSSLEVHSARSAEIFDHTPFKVIREIVQWKDLAIDL